MVENTRGYSAYEIAVQNGFEGTEEEWLSSLTESISTEVVSRLIENKILEDNKKKYYIGKIIIDTENINPATYLKFGTWELWGAGKVPVGVDASNAKFNEAEKIGGSETIDISHTHTTAEHALTVQEMPAHAHDPSDFGQNFVYNANCSRIKISNDNTGTNYLAVPGSNDINSWKWGRSGTAGNGQAHTHGNTGTSSVTEVSTIQPYITCYMWKRVA